MSSVPVHVSVLPYDPAWPTKFDAIKASIAEILSHTPYLSIEHVGSTSVPGLWAKPIIDIDIIVAPISGSTSPEAWEQAIKPVAETLVQHGFLSKGWMNVPGRWCIKSPDQNPKRNIYICVQGCLALRNHLGVRRVLRGNDTLRDEYSEVKRKLSEQVYSHIDFYTEGKTPILLKILNLVEDITAEERNEIIGHNEVLAKK
jgi:GrpB-like predicted nucleotidyltransferase (UPF0157 family)